MLFNIPFKIPIILVISIILVLIIRIYLKKGSTGYNENLDKFLKREMNSNTVTKDINSLDLNYVVVNESDFPFKEYENTEENKILMRLQKNAKRKIGLKMIKFENFLTNTELKEKYGINNFDKISLYEEHFKGFITNLYDWAKQLYLKGNVNDAKIVLEKALSLEENISKIYVLLADIYSSEKDTENLIKLKNKAENSSISMKSETLGYINKLIKIN